MGKIVLGLLAAFAATILAARIAFEVTTATTTAANAGSANEPWALSKMELVSWNNQRWTAWIRDGAFELVPQDTTNWHRHSNVSLAFIDWRGEPWQAKIDGEEFQLAHRGDWSEVPERAHAIRYRDWLGNEQLRTVAQLSR